jgi:hypothetical protein
MYHQVQRFSRDGRWIYFGAYFHAGQGADSSFEIRRMPADGGPSVPITPGAEAQPSDDDRWLFVARREGARTDLWRLRLPDGEPELFARRISFVSNFIVGRQSVFVVEKGDRRHEVATLGKPWWYGLALSPDEHYLIVPAVNQSGSDLELVEPLR